MFITQQSQAYLPDSISSSPTDLPNSLLDAISTYTDKKKKPKRNRSAFILFSIDIRKQQGIKALDELNPNDKFVKIAQLWKEADEPTRNHYEQQAKQEKVKYASELSDFCKTFPTAPIQRPKNYIKKPCNAYGYFLKEIKEEIRSEQPEMRMCEVLRIVGDKWKRLAAEDREKYEKQADASRKTFKEEVVKQMETMKKIKTDSASELKNTVVRQQQQQETLVSKDAFVPEIKVEQAIESSSTSFMPTQKESSGHFKMAPIVLSPPTVPAMPVHLQPESFGSVFSGSLQAFQQEFVGPKGHNVLENLYWKVEKLRQLILMQIQTIPRQQTLPFMGYSAYQALNRTEKVMNWDQACIYESPSSSGDECKKEESQ